MVRNRIAAVAAAVALGMAALVGSAAPAAAVETRAAAGCEAWKYLDGTYITNDATGEPGGGLQVERQRCPSSDFPGQYYYRYRLKLSIYGEMRSNTRAVAKLFGDTDQPCYVYPTDDDQYCMTSPVTGADKAWGIVQERRNDTWVTYARGGLYI